MSVLDAFIEHPVKGRYQPPTGTNAGTHLEERKPFQLWGGKVRVRGKLVDDAPARLGGSAWKTPAGLAPAIKAPCVSSADP